MGFVARIFISWIIFQSMAEAFTEVDCYKYQGCIGSTSSRGGAVSSNPSFGNQIRLNPSAVPTDNTLGVEAIYYRSDTDLSLVKGLGRVGAGISPANNEETFFGPPALEMDSELLERKLTGQKYKQQKLTAATALSLYKGGSGLSMATLQLGVMGKYNYLTKGTSPGGGLSGTLGPLSFNYSIYNDENILNSEISGVHSSSIVKYQVRSMGLGVYLGSVLLDYSVMSLKQNEYDEFMTVRLANVSVMIKKFMFTLSKRDEDSSRPYFNFETLALESNRQKTEYFGGVQVFATGHLMLGCLYNYYLLHEFSAIGTFFF